MVYVDAPGESKPMRTHTTLPCLLILFKFLWLVKMPAPRDYEAVKLVTNLLCVSHVTAAAPKIYGLSELCYSLTMGPGHGVLTTHVPVYTSHNSVGPGCLGPLPQ
jgi:hypothetical protein